MKCFLCVAEAVENQLSVTYIDATPVTEICGTPVCDKHAAKIARWLKPAVEKLAEEL